MLELHNGQRLLDALWESTSAKVVLPESIATAFFEAHGPERLFYDNRRCYHRFHMRGKAVLKRGRSLLDAYTKDISRLGVGFLSPVPLLPRERVKLRIAAAELSVEVMRCRRIDARCFECGAKFVFAAKSLIADAHCER